MTHAKDPLVVEKEVQLQEAITVVQNGKHTCHSAAITFEVPQSTLYERVNSRKQSCNLAHESKQILSHMEERELVQWITCLTTSGYPPCYSTLKEIAEEVRKRQVK